MGNRFDNLQKAVNLLFAKVGAIHKISSVYESPAMGFEGDAFLNCAVLAETEMTPPKILKTIMEIEKSMGRRRKTSKKYTSRPIDIDIILIDDLVVETQKLSIPHPEMENRKFVLQPLIEIDSQLLHPVSRKNTVK